VLSAATAGPFPFPSFPWQTAQYASNISLPEAGEVFVIGARLTVVWLCVINAVVENSAADNNVLVRSVLRVVSELNIRITSNSVF
jgi:hypothetical protein